MRAVSRLRLSKLTIVFSVVAAISGIFAVACMQQSRIADNRIDMVFRMGNTQVVPEGQIETQFYDAQMRMANKYLFAEIAFGLISLTALFVAIGFHVQRHRSHRITRQ